MFDSTKPAMMRALGNRDSDLQERLAKLLMNETELSLQQKEKLVSQLKSLFSDDQTTGFKGYLGALDALRKKESARYRSKPDDEREAELLELIVMRKESNDAVMFRPVDEILNDYPLSEDACRQIRRETKTELFSLLSSAEKLRFVGATFPFFSKVKRFLLHERENGMLQYEYILQQNPDLDSERYLNTFSYAYETKNYQMISNDMVVTLVERLVDKETNYKQFGNVIRPWFVDASEFNAIGHPSIKLDTIFRIAYAFKLDIDSFEYLCEGSVNSVWDALDAAQDILRFGLHFHLPYQTAIQYAVFYAKNHQTSETGVSPEKARAEISSFFETHDAAAFAQDPNLIQDSFYTLLDLIGSEIRIAADSTEQAVHFSWRNNHDDMLSVRTRVAAMYIQKTAALLTEENQNLILDRIADAADSRGKKGISLLTHPHIYVTRRNEVVNLFRETIPNADEKLTVYDPGDSDSIFNLSDSDFKNKENLMMRLCDGKYVNTGVNCEWNRNPLTTNAINSILGKNTKEVKIHRDIILRIAYLYTLVRYLIGELTEDTILNAFDMSAADMLKRCMYLPLNVSLPLDLLLYESLAERELFKPAAYQMFIPRNKKTR